MLTLGKVVGRHQPRLVRQRAAASITRYDLVTFAYPTTVLILSQVVLIKSWPQSPRLSLCGTVSRMLQLPPRTLA
jgi:hypothetical protein